MSNASQSSRKFTVRSATSLGVGSIVGAGIFALMGVAATHAGSAIWISFLVAGIIALLTGHSFAQLGVRYPSRGGVVEYLVQAYGTGWFSGSCSILYYIASLIGMAMISLAFGKFAVRLLDITSDIDLWGRVLASGLIIGLSALNLIGSEKISYMQRFIVIANLVLLTTFAIALAPHTVGEGARYAVDTWPALTPILGSLALTFFAFTGFEVISNTAQDMENPARDLPRAMYITITFVIVLYVALALAVVGVVSNEQLVSSGPLLLVEAAKSIFGEIGFTVLLVSAVVSSVTCLNGGLFGITGVTFTLAERGQLPPRFKKKIAASTRGLTISAALALLLTNFFSLATVASLGSATTLLAYSLVNYGALRLVREGGRTRILIASSVLACSFTVLIWIFYTLKTAPGTFVVFLSFLVISFVIENLLRRHRGNILSQEEWDSEVNK